jgi:hypothetical protein
MFDTIVPDYKTSRQEKFIIELFSLLIDYFPQFLLYFS